MDLDAATGLAPGGSLGALEASGDIQEIGAGEIDGFATTHYRAIIDVDQMAETTAFIRNERQTWRPVVRQLGLTQP